MWYVRGHRKKGIGRRAKKQNRLTQKRERATLIGRCVIIPELRSRLGVGCTMEKD